MTLRGGPVRAVLFDYGLTLVDLERPAAALEAAQATIAAAIAAAGHVAPSVGALQTAVHDRVEAEVRAHESTGALEEVDVAALERRAFADLGLHLGAGLLDTCSRMIQEAWFHGVRPYPETHEVLRELRATGLRLGVCSNAAYRPASMREQLTHTGIAALVDASVFSSEVGWRKPSPILFATALTALGCVAAETVFVGDRLREDVGGAQGVGMRTILVRRGDVAPGDGTAVPDAVVGSLHDVHAALRRLES